MWGSSMFQPYWRSRTLVAATVAVVGLGAAFSWLCQPLPLTRSAMEQIQLGMTRAQVCSALDCPPGKYPAHMQYFARVSSTCWGNRMCDDEWACPSAVLEVWYDMDGNVCKTDIYDIKAWFPTKMERLQGWLGQLKGWLGL